MPEHTIPLEHVIEVLREPIMVFDGERYFVVAQSWSPEDMAIVDFDDDIFGHLLIRIDARTGKSLPRESAPLPTWH